MASIYINGRVRYMDMTPASNAKVIIRDLDVGPGGSHDEIFKKTTDSNGRFSGNSENWKDQEGYFLPDILNLEFEVKIGSRTHKGPFVRIGNTSVDIIFPELPPKPVSKQERELVQVISLTDDYKNGERALYQFIETSSEVLAKSVLGNDYKKIHVLKGNDATLENFKKTLNEVASQASTEAIDVIFNTHGLTSVICFSDDNYSEDTVKEKLCQLPTQIRSKFRAFFSTACYGKSHLDTWLEVGFSVASGAIGIYADSAASYFPFLSAWENEKKFNQCVKDANNADPLKFYDNLAKAFYRNNSDERQALKAEFVDSKRYVQGNGDIKIYSKP